jgi:PAS domain-containing protein
MATQGSSRLRKRKHRKAARGKEPRIKKPLRKAPAAASIEAAPASKEEMLQAKVDELSRANNDMKNLLNSTDIATLFLDGDLRVRRFTPPTARIIKLIPGDAGRPITDITSDLDYPGLAGDAHEVLRTLIFKERQAATHDGRWFAVRIMPYRTIENVIDGVVITFTDISGARALAGPELRRRAEERLERGSEGAPQLSEADARRRLHELEVHQIELEMQNEELRAARLETEAGLARYTELFDFAPIGYAILEPDGIIREINHTGARLLGRERAGILGLMFGDFVAVGQRGAFNALLEGAQDTEVREICDVELLRAGATPLSLRGRHGAQGEGAEARRDRAGAARGGPAEE